MKEIFCPVCSLECSNFKNLTSKMPNIFDLLLLFLETWTTTLYRYNLWSGGMEWNGLRFFSFFFTLLVQDFTTERTTVTEWSGSLGSGF